MILLKNLTSAKGLSNMSPQLLRILGWGWTIHNWYLRVYAHPDHDSQFSLFGGGQDSQLSLLGGKDSQLSLLGRGRIHNCHFLGGGQDSQLSLLGVGGQDSQLSLLMGGQDSQLSLRGGGRIHNCHLRMHMNVNPPSLEFTIQGTHSMRSVRSHYLLAEHGVATSNN